MAKFDLLKFTENKVVNTIVVYVLLPLLIVFVGYLLVDSVLQPVRFNKEKEARELVGIDRLKDIRVLQDAYKSVSGKYMSDIDSLVDFYKNGDIVVRMQIGSKDDSLAMAHTKAIKQARYWLRGANMNRYLYQLYQDGDKNLVFSIDNKIPVRDTLFTGRPGFAIDSLKTIPFSGGQKVEMEAIVKKVSGVNVPLFEARMPYKKLLYGMDNQLRINLDADRRNGNKYEGLQVGSISAPNNNAGNWE
ncbi:MAG: hypothetical protein K5909_00615 [Bacteroidales bacterium]|nr:hypothetical protein [Bacteroidales bacterium]